MTEEQNPQVSQISKNPKNPNYFVIGLYDVLHDILTFVFFPLMLIIIFIKWKGGDPKTIKFFKSLKNPPLAIFLTILIWSISFMFVYTVCSVCF